MFRVTPTVTRHQAAVSLYQTRLRAMFSCSLTARNGNVSVQCSLMALALCCHDLIAADASNSGKEGPSQSKH